MSDIPKTFVSPVQDVAGVVGENTASGDGVFGIGHGLTGRGVVGTSEQQNGVTGVSSQTGTGVWGVSEKGNGVFGESKDNGAGVEGLSINGTGVIARSSNVGLHAILGAGSPSINIAPNLTAAVFADDGSGTAIYAACDNAFGVWSTCYGNGVGVIGSSALGKGLSGQGGAIGVSGESENGFGVYGWSSAGFAGKFFGNVSVVGVLSKSAGGFKIDHPLDPENKYLSHSFVESPEMLNFYSGNLTTDSNGDATIMLPAYFEALNRDFRYQLTAIGQFAQAIVSREVQINQFAIKTDRPNVKVSWQVTGVRKDRFASMHRILIEEDKPANERGKYLHPEAHGKPEVQSIKSTYDT